MLGPGRDVQIWPLLGEGVRIANLCCLWTLSKERHWFLTFVPRGIKQKSPWGAVGCRVATLALVLLGEGSSSSSSSRSQSAPHWSSRTPQPLKPTMLPSSTPVETNLKTQPQETKP